MKSAWWGWEANSMQNDGVLNVLPVQKSIVVYGYVFDVSLSLFQEPPFFGAAPYAIALFQAVIADQVPTGIYGPPASLDFGNITFKSMTGKEGGDQLGFNTQACSDVLCTAMLNFGTDNKDPVNKTIVSPPGLSFPINAGRFIVSQSSENGIKMNFQAQLTLFYDWAG